MIGLSALLLALWPGWTAVLIAEIAHGFTSCVVTPAIAGITLALVSHGAIGTRLGANTPSAAVGTAGAALMRGPAGWWIADRGPLLMTALLTVSTLGGLFSIRRIRTRPDQQAVHHAARDAAGLRPSNADDGRY